MKHIRKLNNQKGSSLLFVLFIISVLILVGSSLLSLSIMSLKISRNSKFSNSAYYVNDALSEEVIAKVTEITHRADAYASKKVNEDKDYLNSDDWVAFIENIETGIEEETFTKTEAKELLDEATKLEYERVYFKYLVDDFNYNLDLNLTKPTIEMSGDGLKNEFELLIEEIVFSSTVEDVVPVAITLSDSSFDSDDKLQLIVKTDGDYGDRKKKIRLELQVHVPEYDYAISNTDDSKTYYINDIHQNALTARGDILITGGNVDVTGDIYSYGTYPEEARIKSYAKGGVVVGFEQMTDSLNKEITFANMDELTFHNTINNNDIEGVGKLSVDGNISAQTGIHLMKENSSIDVTGSTLSNIFAIESVADDSSATIAENMYLYEDLLVFGDKGTITIGSEDRIEKNGDIEANGQIWGFFAGDPAGTQPDRSSSIIIASDEGSEKITANKVFVPGTAYINAFKTVEDKELPYQTGESVVANDKYKFYYQKMLSHETSFTKLEKYLNESDGAEVFLIELLIPGGEQDFKTEHFLRSAKNATTVSEGMITAVDKNKIKIRSLNMENPTSDDLEKNYILGAMVASDKVFNPQNFMSIATMEEEYQKKSPVIDERISLLGTRNYSNNSNNFELNSTELWNLYLDMDAKVKDNPKDKGFVFFSKDEDEKKDENLFINIPPVTTETALKEHGTVYTSNDIEGIIVTEGNVYIYSDSDFSFTGTIIAKGDIVIYGSGEKTITHSENMISYMVAKNRNIRKLFHSETGKNFDVISGEVRKNNFKFDIIDDKHENFSQPYSSESLNVVGSTKKKTTKTFEITSWREVY